MLAVKEVAKLVWDDGSDCLAETDGFEASEVDRTEEPFGTGGAHSRTWGAVVRGGRLPPPAAEGEE